jgi:hypothetical protein
MAGEIPRGHYNFEEHHIDYVWQELHERFGFNLKAWKARFDDYEVRHPKHPGKVSLFYWFGYEVINPLLNEIIGRNKGYPTFQNLTDYVAKKHGN